MHINSIVDTILSYRSLSKDWDTYGSDAPSENSILTAVEWVKYLNNIGIDIEYTTPMADGGVGIMIADSTITYETISGITCSNNGDVHWFIVDDFDCYYLKFIDNEWIEIKE